MKPSRHYQHWLQFVSRLSDVILFLGGFYLGRGNLLPAIILLILKLVSGYIISDLVYKRLQAVVEEKK